MESGERTNPWQNDKQVKANHLPTISFCQWICTRNLLAEPRFGDNYSFDPYTGRR